MGKKPTARDYNRARRTVEDMLREREGQAPKRAGPPKQPKPIKGQLDIDGREAKP